jgi:hypothetical protein
MNNVRRTERSRSAAQAISFLALVVLIMGALLVLDGPAPAQVAGRSANDVVALP